MCVFMCVHECVFMCASGSVPVSVTLSVFWRVRTCVNMHVDIYIFHYCQCKPGEKCPGGSSSDTAQ